MDLNGVYGLRSDGSWPSHTSDVHVLLVDHNPTSLVRTASQLQEQLYHVTTAESAVMALKYFEARKGFYDVVIADIHMQDMNIYKFMECIRNQCLDSNMPIILMAENYPMDLAAEAIVKGASYFFSKPPSPIDIIYLWERIVHVTGRIPNVPSIELQKKRALTFSDDENESRKKSQIGQDSRPRQTLMINKHGYYQASGHLLSTPNNNFVEVQNGANSGYIPTGDHQKITRDPSRSNSVDFVCYTLGGVEQKINGIYSNKALNGTTEKFIINPQRNQVMAENEGVQFLSMEGGQLTPTNGFVTTASQNANHEVSGDHMGNMGDMNIRQSTVTGPDNTTEEFSTADDIAIILRDILE